MNFLVLHSRFAPRTIYGADLDSEQRRTAREEPPWYKFNREKAVKERLNHIYSCETLAKLVDSESKQSNSVQII